MWIQKCTEMPAPDNPAKINKWRNGSPEAVVAAAQSYVASLPEFDAILTIF